MTCCNWFVHDLSQMAHRLPIFYAILISALVLAQGAIAQTLPGGGRRVPGQPGGQASKKEGVAESAPTPPASLPTTPVLPPDKSERKRWRSPEIHGYLRFRGDWFKQLDQGFIDTRVAGGAPFPNALACRGSEPNLPCKDTLKSSNMRLRLEPTISLRENTTQIHLQVDILDNLVLGSTPTSFLGDGTAARGDLPLPFFSEGQQAPEANRNAVQDSLRVKRAWAEVETALGRVHFGRMPWQWGVGIYANSGGYDPIHGTYDLDSDFATTVDRVMFARGIPGTDFIASIATDWTSVLPTSAQNGFFSNLYEGQPFDIDDNDDVNQWIFTIARMDRHEEFSEKVASHELALNYGGFLAIRSQKFEQLEVKIGEEPDIEKFVPRDANMYIPDIWLRLGYKNFDLEFEAVSIVGKIGELSDQESQSNNAPLRQDLDIRQFGAVLRTGYKLVDGDLRLGIEVGFATGDQSDSEIIGRTHVRFAQRFPGDGDNTLNAFRFNFSHEVDMILFRELRGTVTNATYFRPNMNWAIGGGFRAKSAIILSAPNVAESTPGDGAWYGTEINLDLGYEDDRFFAGAAYGVLFPFAALDHPSSAGDNELGSSFSSANTGSAKTSQTIQFRLMLAF